MTHQQPSRPNGWLRSWGGIVLVVFLGIAAFFLMTEHTAHLLGVLPFLLLILCPLLHFFLHGRHGGSQARHGGGRRQPPEGGEQ